MDNALIPIALILAILFLLLKLLRQNRKLKLQVKVLDQVEAEATQKNPDKPVRSNKVAIAFAVIGFLLFGLWNELTTADEQTVRCNLTGNNELTIVLKTYSPLVLLWSENGRRSALMNGFLGPVAFLSENTSYIDSFEIWEFSQLDGRIRVKIDLLQMETAVMYEFDGKTQYYYGDCR